MRMLLLLAAAAAATSFAAAPQPAAPAVIVVVDAQRGALLRWPLPSAAYPSRGFQVERAVPGGAAQVIGVVAPGTSTQSIAPERLTLAKKYLDLATGPMPKDAKQRGEFDRARFSVEVLTLQDPVLASYLALSFEDRNAPIGSAVVYTVRSLANNGVPAAVYAASPFTTLQPTPPPQPPADLRGEVSRRGVALSWSGPSKEERNPAGAVTYELRRRDSGRATVLTPAPVLRVTTRAASGEESPGFIDAAAPIETTSGYTIIALDIFGRRGPESAPVPIFFPDFRALDPPSLITSRTADGKAILTWKGEPNRYRKGWTVVRAMQPTAVGEPLTAQPVTSPEYTDATGRVGSTYYYRVAAVNVRGESGDPAVSEAVLIRSGKAPAAPANLTAELKSGRVILRWDGGGEEVAVFHVERSMDGKQWNLLTKIAGAEPRFDDLYPRGATGAVSYRVVAWSYDDTPSAPSAPIEVRLPDTEPPLPPVVNSIDGSDGKVVIAFTPGGGANDATGFVVLRSLSWRDPGAVVNAQPLGAAARTFTDTLVESGTTYFYRLVAVDAAGNRSSPTDPPATVRVSDPPLPQPPAPKLRFEAAPFPRVIADFPPSPSPSVRYALERRDAGGRWFLIQGPFPQETTTALDAQPLKGTTSVYRLVTVSASGTPGPRSVEVEVGVPK